MVINKIRSRRMQRGATSMASMLLALVLGVVTLVGGWVVWSSFGNKITLALGWGRMSEEYAPAAQDIGAAVKAGVAEVPKIKNQASSPRSRRSE